MKRTMQLPNNVLILVFVELTFWEGFELVCEPKAKGLNPCFCGTYLLRNSKGGLIMATQKSLNPCFCGTYLLSYQKSTMMVFWYCLNPCFCGTYLLSFLCLKNRYKKLKVLILVFVELTFWEEEMDDKLNYLGEVLILVFVELTFWGNVISFVCSNALVS